MSGRILLPRRPRNSETPVSDSFVFVVPPGELSLDLTFASGQVFRWRPVGSGCWEGPLGAGILRLARDADTIHATSLDGSLSADDVRSFLRLDTPLADVRADLESRDPSVAWLFESYPGLRILRQEPVECLLSFVCSAATSIARIRWSVDELCRRFGEPGSSAFPAPDALAEADAEDLRVGGMEFRCRNLSAAARALCARGGERFLECLRVLSYEEAAASLIALPGVGRKIADCALLFSLGFDSAFPLDTHTWRMVEQHCGLAPLRRTDRGYRHASQHLRDKYGPFAGWLQQHLFVASLAASGRLGV